MATLNEVLAQIEELKTIKSDLKEAIVAQGGTVADNTPFEDYAYEIANLDTDYCHGASVCDCIGEVDENGVLQALEPTTELVYPLITQLPANAFKNKFRHNNAIVSFSVPNLETALYDAFAYTLLESLSIKHVSFESLKSAKQWAFSGFCKGCKSLETADFSSLEETDGDYALYSVFDGCTSLKQANFSNLKRVINGQDAISSTFDGCTSLVDFCFDSLEIAEGQWVFYYAFNGCTSLTQECVFPKLKTVTGSSGFSGVFCQCSALLNQTFPELESVSGNSCCHSMFNSCSNIINVSFPKLKSASGQYVLRYMFNSCAKLESVDFSELETISGSNACEYMFQGCTSLLSVSFPKLTNISDNTGLKSMFYNNTTITEVHFRADMQTVIEALDGYEGKFGAANAVIYFDL